MKPSASQRYQLVALIRGDLGRDFSPKHGVYSYMPYTSQQRTYDAMARRGWVEYVTIENGWPKNGYIVTNSGRDALK